VGAIWEELWRCVWECVLLGEAMGVVVVGQRWDDDGEGESGDRGLCLGEKSFARE
jgi:hypothetical protein